MYANCMYCTNKMSQLCKPISVYPFQVNGSFIAKCPKQMINICLALFSWEYL